MFSFSCLGLVAMLLDCFVDYVVCLCLVCCVWGRLLCCLTVLLIMLPCYVWFVLFGGGCYVE